MRLLLIMSSLLFLAHDCSAQKQADTAQRLAFDRELEELASRFELTEEQIDEVKDNSKPSLEAAIKKWRDFDSTVSGPADLDREVVQVIYRKAKPYIATSKLDAYLESRERIWKTNDHQSRRILIYVLSRHLRLNEVQRKQLAKAFAAKWDYRANSTVRMAVFNGVEYLDTVLEEFGVDKIEPVLSSGQCQLLSDLKGNTANFSDAMSKSNEWKANLQSKLELALKLELGKLIEVLELKESQITKLKIAGKGSTKKLIRFHESSQFTFDDIPNVGVIMESFFEQIDLQGIWSRTIEKVLSDEQYAKWNEMESVRKQWRIDTLAYMNVVAACDGRGATFEERQALFDLFREKVTEFNDTDAIYALYFRVAEASDEEIRAVVGDELWVNMQDRLGTLRGSLEKLKSGKVESTRKRQ